jgi:small-conductance mechanosensitive channel
MIDSIAEALDTSAETVWQLIWTIVAIIATLFLRWGIIRAANRRTTDPDTLYRFRKGTTYGAAVIIVVAIARIWADLSSDMGTFLGLITAGLAVALADVFVNMAGWVYIMTRNPFAIGDRVEIGGDAGDVVDIRMFRFTLLEIEGWVDGDQPTGRLVHVPNGALFRDHMANYSLGFDYIWHEIQVLITFESDWQRAESMMLDVLAEHRVSDEVVEAAKQIKEAGREFYITAKQVEPTVIISVQESGVQLTARLLVKPWERRKADDEFWRALLIAINQEPAVTLAYPTVRFYQGPEH